MRFKDYYTQKQINEMWGKINSYPPRVRDEFIQKMYIQIERSLSFIEDSGIDSPIEQILAIGLDIEVDKWMEIFDLPINHNAQVEIKVNDKKYRVDFLISVWCTHLPGEPFIRIAIECDGHEFHEKTKEQVARDKARDRAIQSEGITLLRFSGSEIYRDTWSCFWEIERTIKKLLQLKNEEYQREED